MTIIKGDYEMTDSNVEGPEPDPGNGTTDPKDYEVGYCKPPKHGQFAPGNKKGKGRKKGSKGIKAIANEVLGEKLSAKIDGKAQKIEPLKLSLKQLAKKAGSGDAKAIAMLIDLAERYGPVEDSEEIDPEETAYDLKMLAHLLKMQGVQGDPGGESDNV